MNNELYSHFIGYRTNFFQEENQVIAEFVRIGDLLMTTLTPEELAAVISAMNKVYVAIERREHERKAQITAEKRVRKISIE